MKVIRENCRPEEANDKSLPYTAYLIQYKDDGETKFDLAVGNKRSEIFDYYWDLYRENFITMSQSQGRINPKLWQEPVKKKEKK